MSKLEDEFQFQIDAIGVPPYEREYWFAKHIGRKWRFDFAFPELMIAVECEGGTWGRKSRHTTGSGFEGDCSKYNTAALMGWTVLRVTSTMIKDGRAIGVLEEALGGNGER